MSNVARVLPSPHRQKQLSYVMELGLVGMLFIGLERGDGGIVVNTTIALLVTQFPPLLERDYEIPMDPRLTLWITSAVFLHTFGAVGFPGMERSFYTQIWWWDHVTHALSASVVAGVGYATVRALHEHADGIYFPDRFIAVFILLFVLAFGVMWEILEFAIAIAAEEFGVEKVLTQYGIDDTMRDLVFNAIGGLLVALWGGVYLTDVVGALRQRFESSARP